MRILVREKDDSKVDGTLEVLEITDFGQTSPEGGLYFKTMDDEYCYIDEVPAKDLDVICQALLKDGYVSIAQYPPYVSECDEDDYYEEGED